jgi:hypothetical protein
MRQTAFTTRFLASAVCASALFLAACTSPSPTRPGRRLIIFFDQSGSIGADQRRQWLHDATGLVQSIGGGSSIVICGIHDHTLDAAPLFEADVPIFRDDGTSKTLAERNAAIQAARRGAMAALEEALNQGGAARTDVFSAIDRVHPDVNGRATTIAFFSDMLNSTAELNMERAGSVTLQNIPALIGKVARLHMWQKDTLRGCQVYCVLNSIELGGHGPQVDRRVQQLFYQNLFEALGGKLVRYETSLGGLYASR